MATKITDVSSRSQLMRYAATAQLEYVRQATGYTHERVRAALRRWNDPGNFHRALRDPTIEFLSALDDRILSLAPELSSTGGLAALSVRLGRPGSLQALTAGVPPAWRHEILAAPADSEMQLLSKGSALLAELLAVPENTRQVAARHSEVLAELVRRLILIGAAPPSHRSVDALILLGSIAGSGSAFDEVERVLERELRDHPLGFRIWRAATSIVHAHKQPGARIQTSPTAMIPWLTDQVEAAEQRRSLSLFPARSLDLELCIATPIEWSPPSSGKDWIDGAMRRRIENPMATIRERGTAAHGLWRRALKCADPGYQDATEKYLRSEVSRFRKDAHSGGVRRGLLWVASTVQAAMDDRVQTTVEWPGDSQAEEFVLPVRAATQALPSSVPSPIRATTILLVEHSVLQNSGVIRRHAIDALAASGWSDKLLPVYALMLEDPRIEPWLQCRVLFALSFLQDRSRAMAIQLERSCAAAEKLLADSGAPAIADRGAISQMHAALFAVGDCFGSVGTESIGQRVRARIDALLGRLQTLSREGGEDFFPIARAATYVLVAMPRAGDASTRSLLLELSQSHEDEAVRRLAAWGQGRFDKNLNIKPVHEMHE